MTSLDLAIFQWMAAGHHPHPWLLPVASAIARSWGAWACAGLLGWAAWRQPRERGQVAAALVASAAAALLAHAIAAALNFPRPFMLGLSPAYIAHGARGALPSAHAAAMFTAALALVVRPRLRAVGTAVAAVAAGTAWARIYVGVHFPRDIAAGLLLACVIVGVLSAANYLCRHHFAASVRGDGS